MTDTRLRPPAAYPASASGELAYAADGWPQGADPGAAAQHGRDAGHVLRVLALIAVAVGLAALTAAACVLSYSSVHRLAIQAGVHGRLASIYPIIFDALLVVAGCSVLALRGAGLVSRMYSWLCMLVLLVALAAGGALHPAAVKIPHKLAAVVAAIVPWALVLIGFGLLVALLRYARQRRLGRRNGKRTLALQTRPPEVTPAMVGAPVIAVTEREREEGPPQRPLIPGLPPRAPAITAPDLEPDGEEGAAAETADTTSGSISVEPPTVPNRAAVAASAPMTSAVPTAVQDPRAAARVEMQLRARTARLQAQETVAGVAVPEWQEPFTPKVERAAPAEQEDPAQPSDPVADAGDAEPEDAAEAGDEAAAAEDALPKRVPGQQPVISGFESRAADPGQKPSAEPAATESPPAEQDSASAPGAAPAASADDEDADGLPAFRRTRSTPTPPQDD